MEQRPTRPRVLIADNLPRQRLLAVAALAPHFDVFPLAEGEDPLRVARAQRPELVLLSLSRAAPDGVLRICRTLRTDIRAIEQVAVYTVGRPLRSVEQVCDVGRADGYLAGAFDSADLLSFVEAVLRGERPVRVPDGAADGVWSRWVARARRAAGR